MSSTEMIGVDASGTARPMRVCGGNGVGCGQVDDHPRHGDLDDNEFHLDCHAAMGCQSCRERIAGADGATGAALLESLLVPVETEAAATDHTEES